MTEGQFRIRDLELVVALHEEGNMTQAAKRLGMSEPALTACGGTDHFPAGVPANGNGVNCMPRGAVGAKVEVV
jgi:Bacterial regulatory helix-turn-helix protein, lysR family